MININNKRCKPFTFSLPWEHRSNLNSDEAEYANQGVSLRRSPSTFEITALARLTGIGRQEWMNHAASGAAICSVSEAWRRNLAHAQQGGQIGQRRSVAFDSFEADEIREKLK